MDLNTYILVHISTSVSYCTDGRDRVQLQVPLTPPDHLGTLTNQTTISQPKGREKLIHVPLYKLVLSNSVTIAMGMCSSIIKYSPTTTPTLDVRCIAS